jgi:WD40 repeat protein
MELSMKLRGKTFLVFLVIALLATGCAAPETPKPSSTTTSTPTLTPEPSTTPTAAPTSEPPLKTDGPYLTYFRQVGEQRQLVFMDPEGMGRKAISLPPEISPHTSYLSPDGKWLAFYTGSATKCLKETKTTCDLSLNLMNVATTNVSLISHLLSDDYPKNFDTLAQELEQPDRSAKMILGAFLEGITRAIAWSPDSHYLAFAGQMEGLSSDLYVYNAITEKVTRLAKDTQELQWINWSPDGKWVVYANVDQSKAGNTYDIYAVKPGMSSGKYLLSGHFYEIPGWLNSYTYFEHEMGVMVHNLRSVSIESGTVTDIWKGAFFDGFYLDESKKWLALNALTPNVYIQSYTGGDPDFRSGPYLVNLTSHEEIEIELPDDHPSSPYFITDSALMEKTFLLRHQGDKSFYSASVDGSLIKTDIPWGSVSKSPNRKYWAVSGDDIRIYSSDNQLLQKIDLKEYNIIWSPNSSGILIPIDSNIYFVDINSNEVKLLETRFEKMAISVWTQSK